MSKETFIAIIGAIVGPALVLFISEFFRYKHSKKERDERFFYEVFAKRLEFYEEILEATSDIWKDTDPCPNCNTSQEISDFYFAECGKLANLIYRSNMFGSIQVSGVLVSLHDLLAEMKVVALTLHTHLDVTLQEPLHNDVKRNFILSFLPRAVSIKNSLIEFIREESGVYMIDKKTDDFLRDIKNKQHLSKNKISKKSNKAK